MTGSSFSGTGTVPQASQIDHRDGRPPVALAGDAPVAQAVLNRLLPPADLLEVSGDGLLRLQVFHAVEGAGVDQDPFVGVGLGHGLYVQDPVGGLDHHDERQVVLLGELEVALVVGRDRHDAAGAVVGQDEVRRVDRHLPPRDGVQAVGVEEDALLLVVLGGPHLLVLLLDLLHELPDGPFARLPPGELHDEGMLRGDQHEGGAEDRVLAGREDLDSPVPSAIGKEASQPKLFPIQFFCIVRTRSGQPGSLSQYARSSST